MPLRRWLTLTLVLLLSSFLLAFSNYPQGDELQQIRAYSRPLEFDYVGWTLNALGTKFSQVALGAAGNLSPIEQREVVLDYLDLINQGESQEIGEFFNKKNIPAILGCKEFINRIKKK